MTATLVLEDGTIIEGRAFGAETDARVRVGVQHQHDRLSGNSH